MSGVLPAFVVTFAKNTTSVKLAVAVLIMKRASRLPIIFMFRIEGDYVWVGEGVGLCSLYP